MSHPIDWVEKRIIATMGSPEEAEVQLISIDDAIAYIGWGSLVGAPKLRRWYDFSHPQDARERAFNSGVQQTAIRSVERAIRNGLLRPVVVWPDHTSASALDEGSTFVLYAAEPANFVNGVAITDDFRPGPSSLEFMADGRIYSYIYFQLLWDEVRQLADPACDDVELQVTSMGQFAPISAPSNLASERSRGGGRRPRQHGAPIAAFLARAIAEGVETVAVEKDEALGHRLIAEYRRLQKGPPPDLSNAARDARGAITAWLEASAS